MTMMMILLFLLLKCSKSATFSWARFQTPHGSLASMIKIIYLKKILGIQKLDCVEKKIPQALDFFQEWACRGVVVGC
jgi:hypothetical protein